MVGHSFIPLNSIWFNRKGPEKKILFFCQEQFKEILGRFGTLHKVGTTVALSRLEI